MKKALKIFLLCLISWPSYSISAANEALLNNQYTILAQSLQKLSRQGVTPEHILEYCKPTSDLSTTTDQLPFATQTLLVKYLSWLQSQGISEQELIEYCSIYLKQQADDADRFYKKVLWFGAGTVIAMGIGVIVYLALKEKSAPIAPPAQQPALPRAPAAESAEERAARLARIAAGHYNQNDIDRGFENINHIIAHDPDPQLVGILRLAMFDNRFVMPPQRLQLSDAELQAIPLATFHRAGEIVQENLIGWNAQARINDINNLIDRHMGRPPE